MKKKVSMMLLALLTLTCCEGSKDISDQEQFRRSQAYFDAHKFSKSIEILSRLEGSEDLDDFMVTDHLAQSYASLSGLNVLELYLEVKDISEHANAVELTQLRVGELFTKLPPANQTQLEHMRNAVVVYDRLGLKRPDSALVHNHRLLYRSLYLIYLCKSLFIDIKSLIESKTIGEQLEYLVDLNKKGALLLSEKIMFEMVAMVPSLTNKGKKLAAKLLKSGYFVFRFKGSRFTLDFRSRENGGVAHLIADLFRMGLENLASRLGMDVKSLSKDFSEIEDAFLAIVYGKLSVNEAIIKLSSSSKAQTLILEALKQERDPEVSKESLEGGLKKMSWESVLNQDVDSLLVYATQSSDDLKTEAASDISKETIKKIDSEARNPDHPNDESFQKSEPKSPIFDEGTEQRPRFPQKM